MATNNQERIKLLQEKQYQAMTVLSNLLSFKDWKFAAYKVEEHEKDVVIEALEHFKKATEEELSKLQEETDDDTGLCE